MEATDYLFGAEGHLVIKSEAPTRFVRRRKGAPHSILYSWSGSYSYTEDDGERAGHLKEYDLLGDRQRRMIARLVTPETRRAIMAIEERQDAAGDAIEALEAALNERLLAEVDALPRIELAKLAEDGDMHCVLGPETRLFVTKQRPDVGRCFPSGHTHLTWRAYEYNYETQRTATNGVVDEYVSQGAPIRYVSRVATEPVVRIWEEAQPAVAAARAEWTAAHAARQAALLALADDLPLVPTSHATDVVEVDLLDEDDAS